MNGDAIESAGSANSKRRGKGEARREALLEALESELRTKRLEDVSVARLSAAAGVTRSAFYFYFDSKEAAALAVLSDLLYIADGVSLDILGGPPGGRREHIRKCITATVAAALDHAHVYRAVIDARSTHEGVRESWLATRAEMTEAVAARITELRAAGDTPPGADPATVASVLIGLNESLLDRLASEPEGEHAERIGVVADIWVLAVHGSVEAVEQL